MSERPELSKELQYDIFLRYYYLKNELVCFCRENGLTTTGGKKDLTKRIVYFLKTGERLIEPTFKRNSIEPDFNELSLDSVIEDNFVCSEKHRSFFKTIIGDNFSFNIAFQKYLKSSAGKRYFEAINEWYKIKEEKKKNKGRSEIDSQFEYNIYIRDFFKDNRGKSLKDAIRCWTVKKGKAGSNKYERQDLNALEK